MANDSEAALRALGVLVGRADGPEWLYLTWSSGQIADEDLGILIPHAWTRHDRPETAIGAQAWVQMFRAAGYVSEPNNLPPPTVPFTTYRGAPAHRSRGMAWTENAETAGHHRDRCRKFGETAFVYMTSIQPSAVLARFGSRGEHEIVVDPKHLANVERFD